MGRGRALIDFYREGVRDCEATVTGLAETLDRIAGALGSGWPTA